MPRVFISYAREDQAVVPPLADGLQRAGFDVWWDRDLSAGDAFRLSIEKQLENADVILVIWSKRAKLSRWVADEAEVGVQRGILCPIRIDAARLPLGFGGFNALDLSAWGGDFNAKEWRKLLSDIKRVARAPTSPGIRPEPRVLAKALALAVGSGIVIGGLVWSLYLLSNPAGLTANLMGHPIIDSFVLAFLGSAPITLWSAIEVKRAGFESLTLILRRTFVWLLRGGSCRSSGVGCSNRCWSRERAFPKRNSY